MVWKENKLLIICKARLYFILFYFFSMCFSQLLQHEELYSCELYPHFQPGKHSLVHLEIPLTHFYNYRKSSEHVWDLSTCFPMLLNGVGTLNPGDEISGRWVWRWDIWKVIWRWDLWKVIWAWDLWKVIWRWDHWRVTWGWDLWKVIWKWGLWKVSLEMRSLEADLDIRSLEGESGDEVSGRWSGYKVSGRWVWRWGHWKVIWI